MKKLLPVLLLGAISALAGQYTGYIVDSNCASKKAMWTNQQCTEGCLRHGAKLVLATEDGKVYQIADQSKVKSHIAQKVTIDGTLNGDTISVQSVKM